MRIQSFFLLALILVLVPLPATSAAPYPAPSPAATVQVLGQAGGPTQGVAVQGSYAYIGIGPRLAVVNIADPYNPRIVGYTNPFPDFINAVAVRGSYAYVAGGPAGLRVVNISSPTTPFEIGSWDSPGYAEGLAVVGGTVFLADGPFGLSLVDVASPAAPTKISSAFTMNYVFDVAIEGRYAYLAAGGAGLLLADISNLAYPVELGGYDTPGNARAIAALNGRAYIADERAGLHIINAVDALHPTWMGSLKTEGWALDVTVTGSTAYLASGFGGLHIVNISDPTQPQETGSLTWPQSNLSVLAVTGSRVFLADRKHGLRLVNAADPLQPVETHLFNLFQYARMAVASGNYAYVAAGFNGVRILNISDPAHPIEVSSFHFNGLVYFLHLSGSRLYLGTMTNSPEAGLYILDVSDPSHPQKIGYYDWVQECRGIEVVGDLVYIADTGSNVGIKIVDFNDLSNPKLLGHTSNIYTGSITLRGSLAYTGTERGGLNIFDISNPANITLAGKFQADSRPQGSVKFDGSRAYLSEGGGFRILDVTNPTAPTQISYTPTGMNTAWLWYDAGKVYTAEDSDGIEIFDVSNPAAPQIINRIDTLGSVQTVMAAGDNLYAADMEGGLLIYSLSALTSKPAGLSVTKSHIPHSFQGMQLSMRTHNPPEIPWNAGAAHSAAPDRAAAVCEVTNAADSGPGTLRACLENQAGGDTITFSASVFPPASPATISLTSPLPFLDQDGIIIDASNAGVILDGSGISSPWACGICIRSDGNSVRGLQVQNFNGAGIIVGGSHNTIGGSRLSGSGPSGQGNVLPKNGFAGISIQTVDGYPYNHNTIIGNIVGLNASGNQTAGSPGIGIGMWDSQDNVIGSLEPGKNNIVSGNGNDGIQLYGYTTSGNQILGNYVGTDITGNLPIGNATVGVYVECGSFNTLVQGNLISDNHVAGLLVSDPDTDFNLVIGNRIGVNRDGTQTLPNWNASIGVFWSAFTRIGGTQPGEGNLIFGDKGIWVYAPFNTQTYLTGNQVGLNLPPAQVNDGYGISVYGAQRSIIGGATPAETNTIFQDENYGIIALTDDHVIMGNQVGVTPDGSIPLRKATRGVWANGDHIFIQANQIANSSERGIWQSGQFGTIRRNSIYDNLFIGILLADGGNAGLPAPILTLDGNGGSGTTCPNCTIELFADEAGQGRHFLDSLIADASGNFTVHAYCPAPAANLTATATDSHGNTSQFSTQAEIPWNCSSRNPTPLLVSIAPESLTENGPTTLLAITGSGFVRGSEVLFNGSRLNTRFTNSAQLSAVLPLGQARVTGEIQIKVRNPTPGGGLSNDLILTIQALPKFFLPILQK